MKRYYSIRISCFLLYFFLGCIIFIISAVCGAHHAILTSSTYVKTPYTVIIDAGHGGEDGGAIGTNRALEKEINLAIANLLQDKLTDAGIAVEMIRETDTAVGDASLSTVAERKRSDIQYRVDFVNKHENCILISIHQNFFEQSQYSGAQMFYSKVNPDSLLLAEKIKYAVQNTLQPENKRECKPAENIYLLEHVQAPAVIVECGFLSNPTEADMLCDDTYRNKMAEAIYLGVLQFMQEE